MEEHNKNQIDPVQIEYAGIMQWVVGIGLTLLFVSFLIYATGLVPSDRPISSMTELWHLSASELQHELGRESGWAWVREITTGENLSFAGLVFFPLATTIVIAGSSVLFARRKAWIWVVIALTQSAILVFAALGIVTGH